MKRTVCIVVACLLLISVAAVFLAPSVDLEPTALRAARAATTTMAVMAATAVILTPLLLLPELPVGQVLVLHPSRAPFPDLIDAFCTRLC